MTSSNTISWTRLLAEACAIVASILLAFAVDAWWDNRQERASDIAHLQAVLEELEHHSTLLAEAMESHRATVEHGYELFALLSSEQTEAKARIPGVIDLLQDFYRINAPFGSLQTAMSSGAIARMSDLGLASAIASWPTTIEDLLEEESDAAALIILPHYMLLGSKISLHEVYQHRLANPRGSGLPDVIREVARPETAVASLPVDYRDLKNDIEVRNGFLLLIAYGQSALGEATLASGKLEKLRERLEQCIGRNRC